MAKTCEICGNPIRGKFTRKYCKKSCAEKAQKRQQEKWRAKHEKRA